MAEYFSHDYGARNDPKLLKLQMKMGQEGKGIFWDIVEIIYEQGGYIMQEECESIAFALRVEYNKVLSVLSDFELFILKDGKYYSNTILKRIEKRDSVSLKRSESSKKRWADANALQKDSKCNAKIRKDKKGKDKILKEIKESNIADKSAEFTPCMDIYCKWAKELIGVNPKIDGGDGVALKSIISHIKGMEQVKAGGRSVLEVWQFILDNHSGWDQFHKRQTSLKQINSNFNNIIYSIKNGNSKDSEKDKFRKLSNAIGSGMVVDFRPKNDG